MVKSMKVEKMNKVFPNPALLDQFKYGSGDPLPMLMKYLLSLPNMTSYLSASDIGDKFTPRHAFYYTCEKKKEVVAEKTGGAVRDGIRWGGSPDANVKAPVKKVRVLRMPYKENQIKLEKLLNGGGSDIILIPVMIVNKYSCTDATNYSKHLNIVLYNRKTHEIERIDIKKNHLKNFKMKSVYNKIQEKLVPYIAKFDQEVDENRLGEISVNAEFAKNFDYDIKTLYPVYVIAYLNMRAKHPGANAEKIGEMVARMSLKSLVDVWETYYKFVAKSESGFVCDDDKIFKTETLKCVKRNSKSVKELLISSDAELDKKCKNGLVFDILTKKCTSADKAKNINIISNELKNINIYKEKGFMSLGGETATLLGSLFILSKHKNGHLVYPSEKHMRAAIAKAEKSGVGRKEKKEDEDMTRIVWRFNEETKKWNMNLPLGFWESWEEGMRDVGVRFIICLVSLNSKKGGKHANVLIYDKTTNELERFDPVGTAIHSSYNIGAFDNRVIKRFDEQKGIYVGDGFKYFKPIDFCPRKVYQLKEMDEVGNTDKGSCAVWRLWYIDVRLANPNLSREEVVALSMKKLEHLGSLKRFIKTYQVYISRNIKDKMDDDDINYEEKL